MQTLSSSFSNYTAAHGVGVAQAKPACKHMIAMRKCYQYNIIMLEVLTPRAQYFALLGCVRGNVEIQLILVYTSKWEKSIYIIRVSNQFK